MLPPYARAVVAAREAGAHPRVVSLIYGTTWCDRDYPLPTRAMVHAGDYLAGRYSFWWVAGVPTVVVNHDRDADEFVRFVVELAQLTAPVCVCDGPDFDWVDAIEYFWAHRLRHGREWPQGWDGECERAYAARLARYEESVKQSEAT